MNVRKFFGPTARQALHEVRRALGGEAVILSNRNVEGGVEILAMPAEELQEQKERIAPEKPRDPDPTVEKRLIEEMRAMRGEIETRLSELAWSESQRRDPSRSRLLRDLLHAGFSAALSRYLLERMPRGIGLREAIDWARTALSRNLVCAEPDEIVARGGVYALVGPTGVGKTTTTAKLAARAVVRHGASRVALLTTDSYRVGAHEQLRIYARILGVPVTPVRDAVDLERALAQCANRHLVLIDTVGMSQRDRHVAEQIEMLARTPVQRLLLLSAASGVDTLEDVALAYRGAGLAGCIITKTDEAASLGGALDVAIRHRLRVHYAANGQRVPEDLHPAARDVLVHRAVKPAPARSLFALEALELPAMAVAHA